MKTLILLTKEDINTRKMGLHYEIETSDGTVLNFTPAAMDELINDIQSIRALDAVNHNEQ